MLSSCEKNYVPNGKCPINNKGDTSKDIGGGVPKVQMKGKDRNGATKKQGAHASDHKAKHQGVKTMKKRPSTCWPFCF